MMDILSALRNTSKGKLRYDGSWYKEGVLHEVLTECTSPPSIPAPPQLSTARTTPDRCLPVTGLTLTPTEEEQYKRKISLLREENEGEKETDKSEHSFSSPLLKDRKDSLNRSNQHVSQSPSSQNKSNQTPNTSKNVLDGSLKDSNHSRNTSLNNANISQGELNISLNISLNDSNKSCKGLDKSPRPQDEQNSQTEEELLVPTVTDVDFALREREQNMHNTIKRSLDERRRLFEAASATFGLEAESALDELYTRQERQAQRAMAVALDEQRARSAEAQKYEEQCKERHKQHAQMMDARLKEAQARKRLQEEEEENKRRQEIIEQLETLSKIQQELKTMCTSSVKAITSCQSPQHLSESTKKASQVLVQIIQRLDQLKQAHATAPSVQHIQDALELTKKARACAELIEKGVEAANKQGKSEAEAAAKAQAAQAAAAASQEATKAQATSAAVAAVSSKSDEVLCVDEQSFNRYQKLQEQLRAVQNSAIQLVNDTSMKKYKFELQKAVNTPVNAIAPTSGAHLRDKLQRLCSLLQGVPVDVGGRRVTASDHPAGKSFVKDLFAQKIIKQGEEQVAANHESAFAIAAVTVGIWSQVPDVGDLLLAHLHQRCPYTVPYYLPKKEGQSSEDYYKSLGYLYIDGTVEAQDKFLKRMSGIMRLYASIIISSPPRGAAHPHGGVTQAWLWLANSMNLEPRPDITATMIYDMLAVSGFALFEAYRAQFAKLLQLLCTDYLPKIKAVTPAGSGGPVVRLENFLQKCISSNSVPRPEGMLPSHIWSS